MYACAQIADIQEVPRSELPRRQQGGLPDEYFGVRRSLIGDDVSPTRGILERFEHVCVKGDEAEFVLAAPRLPESWVLAPFVSVERQHGQEEGRFS